MKIEIPEVIAAELNAAARLVEAEIRSDRAVIDKDQLELISKATEYLNRYYTKQLVHMRKKYPLPDD